MEQASAFGAIGILSSMFGHGHGRAGTSRIFRIVDQASRHRIIF
jgi:hypothetical protein